MNHDYFVLCTSKIIRNAFGIFANYLGKVVHFRGQELLLYYLHIEVPLDNGVGLIYYVAEK